MPIYEYRCNNCSKRTTVFSRSFSPPAAVCMFCGSRNLVRLFSRFAVLRSEESVLEDVTNPSQLGDVDETDPRSIARWARRMSQQIGEEPGPEFDEMVAKMEAGEMPEELMEDDEYQNEID